MTHTSSIGPQWPPAAASYGRVKGIDNRGLIRDQEHLGDLLTTLNRLTESLEPVIRDRISIRAVISDAVLADSLERLAPWGEAVIPLSGCGGSFEGFSLVYLGRNGAGRAVHQSDLNRSLSHVADAEERELRPPSEMIDRAIDGGYAVRILPMESRRSDPELLQSMAGLYSRFGWSLEESREILANQNSLIAVAERDGEPVSAGIAELSCVRFGDGNELRLAEFTEAATRAQHQGHGLYSAIVATLSRDLARQSQAGAILGGELNVAFGECSGHDLGVLIAAKRLGRTFCRRVCLERNLGFAGYLPQHVPIAGAPRLTPYNDLFPTFLSRDALYDFVQG